MTYIHNNDIHPFSGLTRGRHLDQVSRQLWTLSRPPLILLQNQIHGMFNYNSSSTPNRALRPATINRDCSVVAEFEDFIDTMGLLEKDNHDFNSTEKLVNFATGFVAPGDVNIDKVFEVGSKILQDMSDQPVNQWKFSKANCVKQMPIKAKAVVQHKKQHTGHAIDTSLCLQRVTLNHCTLEEAICHELSPLPPSLFGDDGFMRDSGKAKRARDLCNKWGVVVESVPPSSCIVFDGGMVLNHLRKAWKRGDTFLSHAEQIVHHVSSAATEDQTVVVVLDGYTAATTKMHVQAKRNPVKSIEIQATKNMRLETTPDIFTSHPANKQRLVDIVADTINQSPHPNLAARKSDGDADTMIVMAGIELASSGECVVIRADDSDILFLCLAQQSTENLFVRRSGLIYDIHETKKNLPPEISEYILVLHGLFGCDTTSGFYRRHSIFSTNWTPVTDHLQVFLNAQSTKEQIQAAGQSLVAHRYNCKTPLNLARNKLYRQKCSNRQTMKQVNLATLPPTEDACNLHSLRAFHQIQEWMGNALPPLEYGWQKIGDELHPIPLTQDPAPKSLLDIRQCGCRKNKCINNQCSCRKEGEYCSDACQCVGCENKPQPADDTADSLLDDTTEDEGEDESEDDEVYSEDDYSD